MIRDTDKLKTLVNTVEGHERASLRLTLGHPSSVKVAPILTNLRPLTQGGMVVVCYEICSEGAFRLTNGDEQAMSEATDNLPKVSLAR